MLFTVNVFFYETNPLQSISNQVSTVSTDGLVHQGMRIHSADYAPMHFYLFMG